jgi:7-dehydrocholesterol reductase
VFYTVADWIRIAGNIPTPVLLSSIQQLYYILRFFTWEHEYVNTMDQQHDRAGFYICWGTLAYIPAMYWLAAVQGNPDVFRHDSALGNAASVACFVLGCVATYILDDIDRQKTRVRADPSCTVWGKPATYIRTRSGALLLTCGGWGAARHLHYVFELAAATAWTAPVAGCNLVGYAYCLYLTILLVNRLYRDDTRCAQKYGDDWKAYCAAVPYRMIPGIF